MTTRTSIAWMLVLTLFVFCVGAAADSEFGPWSVSPNAPVVQAGTSVKTPDSDFSSLGQDYCFMLLGFYQNILSVVSISRCPMDPSCSTYSIDAIDKHGPLMGIMMTADRLFHEGHEQKVATFVWRDGKPYFLDPVENNDFWWYEED